MSAPNRPDVPQDALDRGHEQRDLSLRAMLLGLVALALLTAAAVWSMAVLFDVLESREAGREPAPSPLVERGVIPPEPRLEVTSGEILGRLRAIEDVQLGSYSWVDAEAGIARVPVERAMAILAERGLPARVDSLETGTEEEQR